MLSKNISYKISNPNHKKRVIYSKIYKNTRKKLKVRIRLAMKHQYSALNKEL